MASQATANPTTSDITKRSDLHEALSRMAYGRRTTTNRDAGLTGDLTSSLPKSDGGGGTSSQQRHHHGGAGGMPLAATSEERFQILRDRVGYLEDVLAKSEADRAAVYAQADIARADAARAVEEKMALLHDMHEGSNTINSQALKELQSAREEVAELRMEINLLRQQKERDDALVRDLQATTKKLKKEKKQILAETDGVSLADLHYSNERLSTQLLKLQQAKDQQSDQRADSRVASLESQLTQMTNELSGVEKTVSLMQESHEKERTRLHEQLDRQYQEFTVERAEMDRVIGALGAKTETLLNENQILKAKLSQLLQQQQQQQQTLHGASERRRRG